MRVFIRWMEEGEEEHKEALENSGVEGMCRKYLRGASFPIIIKIRVVRMIRKIIEEGIMIRGVKEMYEEGYRLMGEMEKGRREGGVGGGGGGVGVGVEGGVEGVEGGVGGGEGGGVEGGGRRRGGWDEEEDMLMGELYVMKYVVEEKGLKENEVEGLRREVLELRKEVSEEKKKVSELRKGMEEEKRKRERAEGEVGRLEGEVSEYKRKEEEEKKKKREKEEEEEEEKRRRREAEEEEERRRRRREGEKIEELSGMKVEFSSSEGIKKEGNRIIRFRSNGWRHCFIGEEMKMV